MSSRGSGQAGEGAGPDAGDITAALSRYAAASTAAPGLPAISAEPEGSAASPVAVPVRVYRVGEVAVVLGTFALTMALLDAEGLLTWARRMEVGRVQEAWLAVLTPVKKVDEALGLAAPRRGLIAVADRLGQSLGQAEDPLFVQAWRAGAEAAGELPSPGAGRAGVLPPPDGLEPDAPGAPPPSGPTPAGAPGPVGLEVEPAGASPSIGPAPAEAPAPPEPVAAAAEAPGPATVLLVGDSLLAGSLGSAIVRALANDPRYRVAEAVQSSTGLSRPDVFDWFRVIPPLLERERPRFIVCSFGANDAVPIREGDRLLDFGEPAWRTAYRARVVQMVTALAGTDTRVLWLGLPPMRDKRFAEKARALNRMFASVARASKRVEFIEVDMLVADIDGEYATFVLDAAGRFVRLRLDDGVHYSPAGARLVSRWVVDWLRERTRMAPPARAR